MSFQIILVEIKKKSPIFHSWVSSELMAADFEKY